MLIRGDARWIPLADESVQCVVTSPPYRGLRDYGLEPSIWGGQTDCKHEWSGLKQKYQRGNVGSHSTLKGGSQSPESKNGSQKIPQGQYCLSCSAWRGNLGLEPTIELYVQNLVGIFREVWRVLRMDGTVFLNLGDSYNAAGRKTHGTGIGEKQGTNRASAEGLDQCRPSSSDLKPKDLCMIPARVALALQADGWYLRSDIIWAKPNPMPESVTDRPTRAHEYIFLLAKSERYFFNQDAVREPLAPASLERILQTTFDEQTGGPKDGINPNRSCRKALVNLRRSVFGKPGGWQGGPGRHSGLRHAAPGSEFHRLGREGVNSPMHQDPDPRHPQERKARAPRSKRDSFRRENSKRAAVFPGQSVGTHRPDRAESSWDISKRNIRSVWSIAPQPYSGAHFATFPEKLAELCIRAGSRPGDLVLDPFAGSGTVGRVAERLGRRWVCADLKYQELVKERTNRVQKELIARELECRT